MLINMNTNYELPKLETESCLNPGRKRISELWRGNREVDYEGYLGNEGPTKDTTYHKYVLLAWPERTACEHLLWSGRRRGGLEGDDGERAECSRSWSAF